MESHPTATSTNEVHLNIQTVEDLKLSFQDVLDRELNFKGSFATEQTYKVFPNPCLNVENLGHIGLPLSQRDAKALISECQQAPFGKGTETIVDKEVRNTWQLEPSKVSFDNPEWKEFVDKLLHDACRRLDVDLTMTRPVCELYKLLVYEPGSHFKPHQDTEKTPGMFATMVVILPSKYTGGDVHLKHADSSKVFKSREDSILKITALSWYSDVFHEVKPIETGYRLALSYNLIHRTKIPKPALPSSGDIAEKKLEQVFRAWADGNVENVPSKMLYLLAHQYSQNGLNSGVLKGSDVTRVALMSKVGTPLGFNFALVNLQYYVSGCPNEPADGNDETIVSIDEEDIKYWEPVDLQGNPAEIELENMNAPYGQIEDLDEFIPRNLLQRIRDIGQYHDSDKENYYGNDGGNVEQWYRNTVLIIYHEPDENFNEPDENSNELDENSNKPDENSNEKKRASENGDTTGIEKRPKTE